MVSQKQVDSQAAGFCAAMGLIRIQKGNFEKSEYFLNLHSYIFRNPQRRIRRTLRRPWKYLEKAAGTRYAINRFPTKRTHSSPINKIKCK